MRGPDAYAVLGLGPGASRAEVDQAYRRLIKRYNPDSQGGDSDRAAEINRAYSVLRAYTREPEAPPRPATAPAMAAQLRHEPRSGWGLPLFALAAIGVAVLLAPSMMETYSSSPLFRTDAPAAAGARESAGGTGFSLDDPLATDLIETSVADALRLHAGQDPAKAAEFSRECLGKLSAKPSLPLFDSCVAYDEAIAILGVGDSAFESGAFNPTAITARQVGAGRLLSADYLESESRLQRIRSRVHLVLLPEVPDVPRPAPAPVVVPPPSPELPEAPVMPTTVEPQQIEPRRTVQRVATQARPQVQRIEVAAQRREVAARRQAASQRPAQPQRRRPISAPPPAASPARASEQREAPAWQRPIKPAWQRPLPKAAEGD